MPTPKLNRLRALAFIEEVEKALEEGHYPPNDRRINGRDRRSALNIAAHRAGIKLGSARSTLDASIRTVGREPNWALGVEKRDQDTAAIIKPFQVARPIPSGEVPIDELIERRLKDFERKKEAEEARHLIPVKVNVEGPFGIVHFGDPHVDDDGCDLPTLLKHLNIVKNTEAMFGANVGDLQNNWIGRLARLWSMQSTTARDAWRLVEWMIGYIDWLYLVGGNHDAWSGSNDPLEWITRWGDNNVLFQYNGVRLNLICPNGKEVRINARHDFPGHSMWNVTHGPLRAAMTGWRDHILTCGHKHVSGYQVTKDPMSGLLSHVIRLAGYKRHDRYAEEKGFPDHTISPASCTIIDPSKSDDDPGLVTVMNDIDLAARTLTMMRAEWEASQHHEGV